MFINVIATNLRIVLIGALMVVGGIVAVLAVTLPAQAAQVADCKVDGKDGVKVSIGVNGQKCVPIGGTTLDSNPIIIYATGALKIASGLAGLAAVGGFVWGGFLYITARANAGQVEQAKLVMINSVIGLLLFIFMYAILQFLVPGGIFT